ncbi:MAG: pantoate--beta-alanine ligase [Candidatus Sedimenticola endophacoides]
MIVVSAVDALREQVAQWRSAGERVAFVPTMGNLHDGHLALVRKARELADRVVVSIFVNPLQFGEGEDFETYPRTLDEDMERLIEAKANLLFTPAVETLYPGPRHLQTRVEVSLISDMLCGASRPGHFSGVATVVCKLFNLVQADVAVFGEKDFQQLIVISRMVEDLCLPVEIEGLATVRDEDGLAMSSRNGYLTKSERATAPALYRTLQLIAVALSTGDRAYRELEASARSELERVGFTPDYFQIRRAEDLAEPTRGDRELVILAAARLGGTRLIDNLRVDLD